MTITKEAVRRIIETSTPAQTYEEFAAGAAVLTREEITEAAWMAARRLNPLPDNHKEKFLLLSRARQILSEEGALSPAALDEYSLALDRLWPNLSAEEKADVTLALRRGMTD